jgi:NAD(P)-dependent dehydrogenase (short-subunit alcohol dehydrogenase family)
LTLRKWQRNRVFEAVQSAGLSPKDLYWDTGVGEITLRHRQELGSRNITCNVVAPGYVHTELTASSMSEEMLAELIKMTPLRQRVVAPAAPSGIRLQWKDG